MSSSLNPLLDFNQEAWKCSPRGALSNLQISYSETYKTME